MGTGTFWAALLTVAGRYLALTVGVDDAAEIVVGACVVGGSEVVKGAEESALDEGILPLLPMHPVSIVVLTSNRVASNG
ncbi:hypothetical protein UM93_10695 [Psychromicrobium lacuslunae]|uniref:Uncharacterized protein n=1 Tax=Psychromicrobium lacuslunae TaxID=1618207 RepID=A0A0D4C0B9_9MICC|nr:hypothetical protein UM93_10695 [Psychromicrobium lacuslunae]